MEIMKAAGRDVCGGLEIGVDVDQMLERGARYRDEAAGRKEDVGDDDADVAGHWRHSKRPITVNYVIRQGRRIEVETVETGVSPKKLHKPFKARWVEDSLCGGLKCCSDQRA